MTVTSVADVQLISTCGTPQIVPRSLFT